MSETINMGGVAASMHAGDYLKIHGYYGGRIVGIRRVVTSVDGHAVTVRKAHWLDWVVMIVRRTAEDMLVVRSTW